MRKLIKNDKKMKQRKIAAYFLCFCLLFTSCVDPSVMYSALGVDVLPSKAEAETKASSAIPLKKLSGSGTGFIYNHFVETKQFKKGETYALLDGIYGYEEAVASLGSGAVLKAGSGENGSIKYIQGWYGEDAKVSAYVDVITKGKDFDHVKSGVFMRCRIPAHRRNTGIFARTAEHRTVVRCTHIPMKKWGLVMKAFRLP